MYLCILCMFDNCVTRRRIINSRNNVLSNLTIWLALVAYHAWNITPSPNELNLQQFLRKLQYSRVSYANISRWKSRV